MFSKKRRVSRNTDNCTKNKYFSPFCFPLIIIIATLVILTSISFVSEVDLIDHSIHNALAQVSSQTPLSSPPSPSDIQNQNTSSLSQLNTGNISSEISPPQSSPTNTTTSFSPLPLPLPPPAHSINNTNVPAAEFPPGTNFTKMVGPSSELSLALSKVAIDIPMQKGYENGSEIYFVAFDASDNNLALQITNNSNDFPVHYTKLLTQTPSEATEESYIFTNGIPGEGHLGYQPTIVESKPGDSAYSPLKHVNLVEWKTPSSARELKSVEELTDAQSAGEIMVNSTSAKFVINSPAIKWQDGSLKIREDKVITGKTPFIGGQVTNIDTEKMVVTIVAMRGYGPDGKTIYWSVTDGSPFTDDITLGGIVYAPKDDVLADTPVAVDFYQFINGMRDAGPQGFQPPVSPVNLEDETYSPIWRIYFVAWKDPQRSQVIQTMSDLNQMRKAGMIEITPALEGRHIVNCPFFDQSTVLKFQHQYTEEELKQFEQYKQQQPSAMQPGFSPSNTNVSESSIMSNFAVSPAKTIDQSSSPTSPIDLSQQQQQQQPQQESPVKRITLVADEKVVQVAPANEIHPGGISYKSMVFNGSIPAPVIAVDEGDTLEITLINNGSTVHTLDFHAGYGASQALSGNVKPGESKTWRLKADIAGAFVYHCSGDGFNGIWEHIANGMYGGLIVHPKNEKAAKEFYIVFSELYNTADKGPFQGTDGKVGSFDRIKLLENNPDLIMTNGFTHRYMNTIGGESKITFNENAESFKVKPGELTRWYIVNAGPNNGIAFHIIGTMINVHDGSVKGSLGTQVTNEETWWIPAGSASVIETIFPEEGTYIGLDHSIRNLVKGGAFTVQATNNSTENDHPRGTWVTPTGSTNAAGLLPQTSPISSAPLQKTFSETNATTTTTTTLASGQATSTSTTTLTKPDIVIQNENKTSSSSSSSAGINASTVNIVEGSSFPDNEIFYDPATITIKQGEKVTWINQDSVLHTVTSGLPDQENAGLLFDSKNIGPGASFEYTFDKAGKYDYYCTLHPFMIGSVVVE